MKCEICKKRLTGKQQRFCSRRCRNVSAGRISKPRHKPPDREWLAAEYLLPPEGKGRSQLDIGNELGMSEVTLRVWISKYGLQQDQGKRIAYFSRKPTFIPPTREQLIDQYIEKNKSIREIAIDMGCSLGPVVGWLRMYSIIKPSEQLARTHSRRMSGKNNPAYTNGNSLKYVKRKLLEIKPEVCEWCGATSGVQIHHVDNDGENNTMGNLMWLCYHCNILEAHLRGLQEKGRVTIDHSGGKLIITFTSWKPSAQNVITHSILSGA